MWPTPSFGCSITQPCEVGKFVELKGGPKFSGRGLREVGVKIPELSVRGLREVGVKILHHAQAMKLSSCTTSWWRSFASLESCKPDEPMPLPAASKGITKAIKMAKEEEDAEKENQKKQKVVMKKPAANQPAANQPAASQSEPISPKVLQIFQKEVVGVITSSSRLRSSRTFRGDWGGANAFFKGCKCFVN